MKNLLKGFAVAAAVLILFIACEATPTTIVDLQIYEVGNTLPGGWVVTVADDLGGIVAERQVDDDPEDDLAFGADVNDSIQVLVKGKFGSDISFTETDDAFPTLDYEYLLSGAVVIGDDNSSNATLSIEPGTLIKGEVSSTEPGVLIISRGSSIDAQGTAAKPIVFTSANAVGSRAKGDWGGIVICGNGISDKGADAVAEAVFQPWGGTDNTDNSGTLKYVRVEFAGTLFDSENELNGIAFYGVGSGTTVSYVQVHRNGDDGVEFFGGAVEADHLVLTGENDDSLDFDNGWTGGAQFVIIQQYTDYGDKLIEGDGEVNPTSDPYLANLTIMTPRAEYMSLKVGTEGALVNSIAVSTQATPYMISDSDASQTDFSYDGVIIEGYTITDQDPDPAKTSPLAPVFDAASNVAVVQQTNYDAGITDQYDIDNAIFTVLPGAVTAVDATTYGAPEAAAYIGAYNGTDWWTGWTTEVIN